jgi:hypothetical protein
MPMLIGCGCRYQATTQRHRVNVCAEHATLEAELAAAQKKAAAWDRRWKHWEGNGCACVFEDDGATLKGSMCNAHKALFEAARTAFPDPGV